ncbi:unnamed protein product [Arctogadus glacialis]
MMQSSGSTFEMVETKQGPHRSRDTWERLGGRRRVSAPLTKEQLHAVCIMGSMQAEYSQLDREQQADVTAFQFRRLAQHNKTDNALRRT